MSFREFLIAKRGSVRGSVIDNKPAPMVTRTEKRSGDLVLGAGYKWEIVP